MKISLSVQLTNGDEPLVPIIADGVITWEIPMSDPVEDPIKDQTEGPKEDPKVEPIKVPDPEKGLTITDTFKPGANAIPCPATTGKPPKGEIARNANIVLATDFKGLKGSGGGLIFELGASSSGAYVGFAANGDFHVRCGSGLTALPDAGAAYLIVPAASAPKGDGTLVVEMISGKNAVRAWWNGAALGTPVARKTGSGELAGGNSGTYLAKAVAACTGEIASVVPYTTASDMRYYYNQTVTI